MLKTAAYRVGSTGRHRVGIRRFFLFFHVDCVVVEMLTVGWFRASWVFEENSRTVLPGFEDSFESVLPGLRMGL